jgi:putative thioredoxin
MSQPPLDVNAADFQQEVIERSRAMPVVVDFWATWCAPCRTLGPVLEAAVEQHAGKIVLVKVDADANPELCEAYGISGIPAVKAFRDGRIISEFAGAQPPQIVEAWLAGLLPTAHEEVLETARRLLREDRAGEADQLLRRHLEAQPADTVATLELARLVAARGSREEALALLDRIPGTAAEAEDAARERQLLDLLAAGGRVRSLDEAKARAANAPGDLDARFALAGAAWLSGRPELAMDELLEVVRRDRTFRDDGARRALLALFERLGHDHPAVGPALRKLGMILFP